eukprot:356781-Chlamydomonas_euryale.AAC.4
MKAVACGAQKARCPRGRFCHAQLAMCRCPTTHDIIAHPRRCRPCFDKFGAMSWSCGCLQRVGLTDEASNREACCV